MVRGRDEGASGGGVPLGRAMLSSQNTFGRSVRYDSMEHLEKPPDQHEQLEDLLRGLIAGGGGIRPPARHAHCAVPDSPADPQQRQRRRQDALTSARPSTAAAAAASSSSASAVHSLFYTGPTSRHPSTEGGKHRLWSAPEPRRDTHSAAGVHLNVHLNGDGGGGASVDGGGGFIHGRTPGAPSRLATTTRATTTRPSVAAAAAAAAGAHWNATSAGRHKMFIQIAHRHELSRGRQRAASALPSRANAAALLASAASPTPRRGGDAEEEEEPASPATAAHARAQQMNLGGWRQSGDGGGGGGGVDGGTRVDFKGDADNLGRRQRPSTAMLDDGTRARRDQMSATRPSSQGDGGGGIRGDVHRQTVGGGGGGGSGLTSKQSGTTRGWTTPARRPATGTMPTPAQPRHTYAPLRSHSDARRQRPSTAAAAAAVGAAASAAASAATQPGTAHLPRRRSSRLFHRSDGDGDDGGDRGGGIDGFAYVQSVRGGGARSVVRTYRPGTAFGTSYDADDIHRRHGQQQQRQQHQRRLHSADAVAARSSKSAPREANARWGYVARPSEERTAQDRESGGRGGEAAAAAPWRRGSAPLHPAGAEVWTLSGEDVYPAHVNDVYPVHVNDDVVEGGRGRSAAAGAAAEVWLTSSGGDDDEGEGSRWESLGIVERDQFRVSSDDSESDVDVGDLNEGGEELGDKDDEGDEEGDEEEEEDEDEESARAAVEAARETGWKYLDSAAGAGGEGLKEVDALLKGALRAATLLAAQPPASKVGTLSTEGIGGGGGGGGLSAGDGTTSCHVAGMEVKRMRKWVEQLEDAGAELGRGERAASAATCQSSGGGGGRRTVNQPVVDRLVGIKAYTAREGRRAAAALGACSFELTSPSAYKFSTAAAAAAAAAATADASVQSGVNPARLSTRGPTTAVAASTTTAGEQPAAFFEPGHLKDILDFFTKLELEVARAAPGMATLLPRGLTELLDFVRRLGTFTRRSLGAESPHLSQLRAALVGLDRAEACIERARQEAFEAANARRRAEEREAHIVKETEALRERGAQSQTRGLSMEMELKRVKLELADAREKIAAQNRLLHPTLDEVLAAAERGAEEREAELQRRAMLGLMEHKIAEGIADIETQAGPGLGDVLADKTMNGKQKKKKTDGGKGKIGGKKKGGAGKSKGGGSTKT